MNTDKIFRNYHQIKEQFNTELYKITTRSWFYGNEITNIYNFPIPTNNNYIVGIVSFGGGLFGTVTGDTSTNTGGILTNGDAQNYWTSLGISNMPKVVIKTIGGALNNTSDFNSSVENTIDVENVGMCCPTSKLTIVLYIAPNRLNSFTSVLNTILNDTTYPVNAISISWGAPEVYYGNTLLTQINNILLNAVNANINITVASGDNGSSDGLFGNNCDFPSSSPNVIACGGTTLICPTHVYNSNTIETAWSSGGGGISSIFNKPSYQSSITGSKRNTPDISLVADPNTGVLYLINGSYYIVGGTSIVAPMYAGFIAASYTTKYINPIIYNSGSLSCHDIISGSNGAYRAKVGYDNCTGFGTLNGTNLTNIIKYNININTTAIRLTKNTKYTITTTSNYNFNSYLLWSSSNVNIAKVSNGIVTGVSAGIATITLKTINPYITKTITVTVVNVTRIAIIKVLLNKYKNNK
jgi:subtilase family serine protease